MNQKFRKFRVDSGYEAWVFSHLPDTNIAFADSAYAIAAPIAQVSRERFMDAIRCGSCHAYDVAAYWDGRSKRGGATRLAFYSDSVVAWAHDHAMLRTMHWQQNAARPNAARLSEMVTKVTSVSSGSAMSAGIMENSNEKK